MINFEKFKDLITEARNLTADQARAMIRQAVDNADGRTLVNLMRAVERPIIEEKSRELFRARKLDAFGQRSALPFVEFVNKVSSAIHLRFDIKHSSLPEFYKYRLLRGNDHRISKDGIIVIKAQRHRSQDKNRAEALVRLKELIICAGEKTTPRLSTMPTFTSRRKRIEKKVRHGQKKSLRSRPSLD